MTQELERLRDADAAQRLKMQKMYENLNDYREELENLRARNELLEKKGQK